jgi:hypothetical protein
MEAQVNGTQIFDSAALLWQWPRQSSVIPQAASPFQSISRRI